MATPPCMLLPPELTERILLFCHPRDVSNFSQTCWAAHNLVYKSGDQYLWRELFLSQPFDDIRSAVPAPGAQQHELDWKTELQRRVEAELVISAGASGPPLLRALETCVSAIETSLPLADGEATSSDNVYWLDGVLMRGQTKLEHAVASTPASSPERQLHARLRANLALSHEHGVNEQSRRRTADLRRASRVYVYDLRRYTEETLWGPYRRGDKGIEVNWEHVEHIVNVVGMKLRELPLLALRLYGQPTAGLASTRAYSAPLAYERKPYDWAGISGTWRRFVCFMDYRDLFAFNFSLTNNGPRDPSFFDDEYQEAIRPVELHLEVVEPTASESSMAPTVYPPLHVRGFSRGSHNSDAAVEGTVSVLADGGVRWNFVGYSSHPSGIHRYLHGPQVTKYDGLTQWSAEGIQLGNICSAVGVTGIWTSAFHEDADPAGPFWMWKVSGDFPGGLPSIGLQL
ncbi:hypothetical protein B0H21DRAFT_428535 [Amylocystis lapponica]|nr:hypothetical protein B0H21DRAFT_428535 [Amylocystis lapponica]